MLARLKRFFNPPPESSTDAGLTAPWRVFWVAFLLRLLTITLAHTYRIHVWLDHFEFGFEAGRIARALVEGSGYADPVANIWVRHTGPTAWLPPLYPLVLAAVFKVFGVYTLTSAWVILAINSLFSAFTARAVWELGARFAGRRCGLWSGWIWALYPAFLQYAVKWIWEMSLTVALFTWVLVLAFRMIDSDRSQTARKQTVRWLLFGLLWGLIALSNSTLLVFLPVCGLWILLPTRHQPAAVRGAVLAAIVFLACVTPWTVRNYEVFHKFIPMRGNFGAELCIGNCAGANGFPTPEHPFLAPEQTRLYQQMGEVRYVAMRGALAEATIAADPHLFYVNTLWRIYFFWWSVPHDMGTASLGAMLIEDIRVFNFGFITLAGLLGLALALSRHKTGAGLFLWAMVLLPLPYYAVTAHARFRHPLEPILCVLGVYLFQSAQPRGNKKQIPPE